MNLKRIGLLLVLLLGSNALADDSMYLFTIPTDTAESVQGPLDDAIEATLHVPDGDVARRLLESGGGVTVMQASADQVVVSLGTRATLTTSPEPSHRRSSFVIDYDEPAFDALIDSLRAELGEAPHIADLTQFVFEYIDDKHYRNGFDLASKVAATRAGDCTEHAVLLTALARATGRAARVVFGIQLAETDSGLRAFGHAWTEIHDGKNWKVSDATIPIDADSEIRIRYLPVISLDNEGPGFGLDMARLTWAQPARVSNIRNSRLIL
ncbi:MAG: transglutaminase-like domain-containing protein [Pseudomonadota bacterium]